MHTHSVSFKKGLQTYLNVLQNQFYPFLLTIPTLEINKQWFQQDGATAHTSRASMAYLQQHFPGRVISRFGSITWPARSPDLTAADFFLWGSVKDAVFCDPWPNTIDSLKLKIQQAFRQITPDILKRVMNNFLARLAECIRNEGKHVLNVFHHQRKGPVHIH